MLVLILVLALRPRRAGEHRAGILSQSFTVGVEVGQRSLSTSPPICSDTGPPPCSALAPQSSRQHSRIPRAILGQYSGGCLPLLQRSAPHQAWPQPTRREEAAGPAKPQPVAHIENVVSLPAWPGVWPGGCKGGLQTLARSWLVGKFRGHGGEQLTPRLRDAPRIVRPIFPPIR